MSLNLRELPSYVQIADRRRVLGSFAPVVSPAAPAFSVAVACMATGHGRRDAAAAGRMAVQGNGTDVRFWAIKRDAHAGNPPRAPEPE